jgi:hypothetical protein
MRRFRALSPVSRFGACMKCFRGSGAGERTDRSATLKRPDFCRASHCERSSCHELSASNDGGNGRSIAQFVLGKPERKEERVGAYATIYKQVYRTAGPLLRVLVKEL